MVPITVRPVLPDEYAAVADLTAGVYLGEGYSSESYEPQLRAVPDRAREALLLVCVDDEDLLGAVTLASRGGPWAEHSVPGEAVVRMLVTAAPARGRGVGAALVQACVARARADGCTMVRLSSQENMRAAHRLYERLGFLRTPSLDWSPIPDLLLRTYALPLAAWCGQCGTALTVEGHAACRRAADLDPPRYCAHCRRRMIVQITPTGWTARCSEHGQTSG